MAREAALFDAQLLLEEENRPLAGWLPPASCEDRSKRSGAVDCQRRKTTVIHWWSGMSVAPGEVEWEPGFPLSPGTDAQQGVRLSAPRLTYLGHSPFKTSFSPKTTGYHTAGCGTVRWVEIYCVPSKLGCPRFQLPQVNPGNYKGVSLAGSI